MKKNRIHVLVVEDDTTHGKAILEAFKRAGYQATLCNSGTQGLQTAQRQEFQCVVSDCMLPKMNGIDMIVEIKKLTLTPPKVFLFSGIFKDKNFIKSSVDKTGAIAFFTKPVDVKELLEQVESALTADVTSSEDSPLLRLYSEDPLAADDLIQLLRTVSTIHSVHLPMLYKRLQQAQVNGELTLITESGDLNSVGFTNGRIFSVRTPDKDTYFGGLAVGFGFVSPEEVMEALREPPGKLLGQKLIDSMSLSPHAINVILGEQLALRLSQTVQVGVVSVTWQNKQFSEPPHVLDSNRYESLANDWMRSKIDPEWIQPHIMLWGSYRLQGHYHPSIVDVETINDLLAHPDFVPKHDLVYFFRQLINGNATIGARGEETRNYGFLEHRLSQLLEDFKTQNYFQILGLGEKAQQLEINRSMNELRLHFDPKNLPEHTPPALRIKATKVFQQIEQAFQTLSDDHARANYLMKIQNKRASAILENEPVFRAAQIELQNGQAAKALARFEGLVQSKVEFRDLRAYYIWAGLRADKHFKGMTLDQVPPEERHSAPYLMAKGIWHRQRGQMSKALEAFRTAHVLDPRLAIARSELESLKHELETRGGSNRALIKDVTSVVDGIIGKGKRGA